MAACQNKLLRSEELDSDHDATASAALVTGRAFYSVVGAAARRVIVVPVAVGVDLAAVQAAHVGGATGVVHDPGRAAVGVVVTATGRVVDVQVAAVSEGVDSLVGCIASFAVPQGGAAGRVFSQKYEF